MEFKKYESISNNNNTRTIEYYREKGFTDPSILWYATEKIHGTNFSFMCDPTKSDEVICCQRSGPTEGNFMNHLNYVHKIQDKILNLAKFISKPIQVYCEYYGTGIINKGSIEYRSDSEKDFIGFDLIVDGSFVDYPNNFKLFETFNIPTVAVVGIGSFEELLNKDTDFKSILGQSNNVDVKAEGFVLKPCQHMQTETGERVILKCIANEFAENRPTKTVKPQKIVDNIIIDLINTKDTDVRCSKVAAKLGITKEDKNQFGKLIIELANDISEEFNKESMNVNINIIKKQIIETVKKFFA